MFPVGGEVEEFLEGFEVVVVNVFARVLAVAFVCQVLRDGADEVQLVGE